MRGRELMGGVGKTMMQSGGTFGTFMAIGMGIRCWTCFPHVAVEKSDSFKGYGYNVPTIVQQASLSIKLHICQIDL